MKSFLTSKTIWFGIAQIVFGGIGYFTGWITPDASTALVVTGATSIGLRFKTSQPIV